MVCDAYAIDEGLKGGSFRASSALSVVKRPQGLQADTGMGLAQVGGGALGLGDVVQVRGAVTVKGVVLSRAEGNGIMVEGLFDDLKAGQGGMTTIEVKARPNGQPTLALTRPDGTVVGPSIELATTPKGEAVRMPIPKYRPKLRLSAKVKRFNSGKFKLMVTVRNIGDSVAKQAKLCLKAPKRVRNTLKFKRCQVLGVVAVGKAKSRRITLKPKAGKRSRLKSKAKLTLRATAKGTKPATRSIRVR